MSRRSFLKTAAGLAAAPMVAPTAAALATERLAAPIMGMGVVGGSTVAGAVVGANAIPVPGTARWLYEMLWKTEYARAEWTGVWRAYRKGLRKRRWREKSARMVWAEHRLLEVRRQRAKPNSIGRPPKPSRRALKLSARVRAAFPDWRW